MLLSSSVSKNPFKSIAESSAQPSAAGMLSQGWQRFSKFVSNAHNRGWLPRRFTPSLVASLVLAVLLAGGLMAAVQLGSQSADVRQQAYVVSDPGTSAVSCTSFGGTCQSNCAFGSSEKSGTNCPSSQKCCVPSAANVSCPSGSTCNLDKTKCDDNYLETGSCKQAGKSGVCCFADLVVPSVAPNTPSAEQVVECWDKNQQCNRMLVKTQECRTDNGKYLDRQSCIDNLDRAELGWNQTCQADQGCICPDGQTKVAKAKKCPADPTANPVCPAGYFEKRQVCDSATQYLDTEFISSTKNGITCYACLKKPSTNCYINTKGCSITTLYAGAVNFQGEFDVPKCDGKTQFTNRSACEASLTSKEKICWSFDANKGLCVSSTQPNLSGKTTCGAIDPKLYESAGECTANKDNDYTSCYLKEQNCERKIFTKSEFDSCEAASRATIASTYFSDYNECRGRADEFVCFDAQDSCFPKSISDGLRDCKALNTIRGNDRYHVGLTDCKQQLPNLNIPAGTECPSYQNCVCNGGPDVGKTKSKGQSCAELPATASGSSSGSTSSTTSIADEKAAASSTTTAKTTSQNPAPSFSCRLYVSGADVGPGSVDCRKNPSNGQFIWQKCAPPHTGEGEVYEDSVGFWSPCEGANGSLPSAESLLRLVGLSTGSSCPPASQCTGEVDLRGTDLVNMIDPVTTKADGTAMSVNCSAIKSFNACLATGVCEFVGNGCVPAEVPLDAPHLAGCDDQHVCQEADGCACRAICNKANTVIKKGETCGGYDPKYLTPPEQIKTLSSCTQACLNTSGCGCPGDQCQLSIAEYGYTCNGDPIPVEEMLQAYGEAVGAPLLETCSQECGDATCRCQSYCLLSTVDKNQSCGGLDPAYGANVCGVITTKDVCNSENYPFCEWRNGQLRLPGITIPNPFVASCQLKQSVEKTEAAAKTTPGGIGAISTAVSNPESGTGGWNPLLFVKNVFNDALSNFGSGSSPRETTCAEGQLLVKKLGSPEGICVLEGVGPALEGLVCQENVSAGTGGWSVFSDFDTFDATSMEQCFVQEGSTITQYLKCTEGFTKNQKTCIGKYVVEDISGKYSFSSLLTENICDSTTGLLSYTEFNSVADTEQCYEQIIEGGVTTYVQMLTCNSESVSVLFNNKVSCVKADVISSQLCQSDSDSDCFMPKDNNLFVYIE